MRSNMGRNSLGSTGNGSNPIIKNMTANPLAASADVISSASSKPNINFKNIHGGMSLQNANLKAKTQNLQGAISVTAHYNNRGSSHNNRGSSAQGPKLIEAPMKASASSSLIGLNYSNTQRGSKSSNNASLAHRNQTYQNTNGSASHFNHFKNVSRDTSGDKIMASKRSSNTPFNVTMSSSIKHSAA
jgi:hypothetical protein